MYKKSKCEREKKMATTASCVRVSMSNRAPVIIAHFYYMHSQANLSWLKQCFGYVWFANDFFFRICLFVRSKAEPLVLPLNFALWFFVVVGVFVAHLLFLILFYTQDTRE